MNPILSQMETVSFAYDREPVLRDISLAIQSGEFIGIIGPNGSGKSTLLKLLGGILKTDTGRIRLKEHPLQDVRKKILARSIAWVPQEHPMVFPFRVMDIVMMGRHPYLSALAFEGEEDLRIAHHAMEMTETLRFAERRFQEISGGEKQRVMIASAIAQEPEIMLLDEPTAGLDIKFQMEILGILKRLNQTWNLTLVLALHDLHLASKFCDRLVLLEEGRIVRDGLPGEVLQKEILEQVYGVRVKLFHDDDDGSVMISPEL